ncbi:MAG: DNA polymerase III subunit gamma/tau [Rikenellaceae bacterium]|nr:DNA polymerase III subunit gamma/tau [Rikenellaceae bacterium]
MENFVVSARKYRPATFASVVGQTHITSTLKNAIARGQLAHAYLFCGPRGVGKTTCARIFAKAINCFSPIDNEACNECESCRSFNEGRSFNIHELDAASNNSVEDIRSLVDQVRIPPQVGRYSVYIIDEVHMLSPSAFNAFLKTLEEPPAHAIFILATTEKHKIIPTILSRCQIFDFNRIRVEDSVGYLKYIAQQEGVTYDDESLNLIAQKADGGMRDALSMFDKAVSFCGQSLTYREVARSLNVLDYDTYFTTIDTLMAGDYTRALLLFDRVLSAGFSAQTFMAGLAQHCRDLLMCRDAQTLPLLEVTGTLLDRYRAQAATCDAEFLFGAITLLAQLDATIRTATNRRLTVELGLMKLCRLSQKKNEPIGDLESFELPQLNGAVVAPSVAQSTGTTPQGQTPQGQAPQVQTPQPKPATQPTPPVTQPKPVQQPTPPSEPKATGGAHSPISGTSLADLLKAKTTTSKSTEEGTEQVAINPLTAIDPLTEQKIANVRERFIAKLREKSMRMALAFETLTVDGNRLTVEVESDVLEDEILHHKNEVLQLLKDTAAVTGTLELELVRPEVEYQAPKPIRVEDRMAYLVEKNPVVAKLRKALELDLE